MVEWPRRYSVPLGAASSSARVKARTGMACAGIVPSGLLSMAFHHSPTISPKLYSRIVMALRNFPSANWGDCACAGTAAEARLQ